MKLKKPSLSNIVFLSFIVLMLIPQTRKPIQVLLHKGVSLFINPTVIQQTNRKRIQDYNWQLVNQSGKAFNFKDTRHKVVVLNFWATWCPPCIAEMPSLQESYNKFQYNNDIVFLFVSNDSKENIAKFMQKNKFSFEVYTPQSATPEQLQASSIPRTLIINKKGEIVIDHVGAADWNSKAVLSQLNQLLQE